MSTLVALLAAYDANGALTKDREGRLAQIPHTSLTAIKLFKLDGVTTRYAVCPTCHCNYAPNKIPGSSSSSYPETCVNIPFSDSPICSSQLLESGAPIKSYLHHHFPDYLANLLSDPALEQLMDDSCNSVISNLKKSPPHLVTDILEALYVKNFCEPDGRPYYSSATGRSRYLFALHVDFFAPEGLSIHGSTVSCEVICIMCLNLPLGIRYKLENMCLVGVILGPKEPTLNELNHYIRHVVDEFLPFWEHRICFSRTALHPKGKTCKDAIVPLICDSLAAQKLNQMTASRSHWYCTRCKCYHQSTLSCTDSQNWILQDKKELHAQAEAWRSATSATDRDHLVKDNGIRYSELWHLPYYDPAEQTVTDPMHCLLEGVVQHHCCQLLKLTSVEAAAPPKFIPAFSHDFSVPNDSQFPAKDLKEIIKVQVHLTAPSPRNDSDSIE